MSVKTLRHTVVLTYPTGTFSVDVEGASSDYEATLRARNSEELREVELLSYPVSPRVERIESVRIERRQVGLNAWVVSTY